MASSSPESSAATVVAACWGMAFALLLTTRVLAKYHAGFRSLNKLSTILNILFASVNLAGLILAVGEEPIDTKRLNDLLSILRHHNGGLGH